jgi:hypothetical protein
LTPGLKGREGARASFLYPRSALSLRTVCIVRVALGFGARATCRGKFSSHGRAQHIRIHLGTYARLAHFLSLSLSLCTHSVKPVINKIALRGNWFRTGQRVLISLRVSHQRVVAELSGECFWQVLSPTWIAIMHWIK